jgi:hypothetical protein
MLRYFSMLAGTLGELNELFDGDIGAKNTQPNWNVKSDYSHNTLPKCSTVALQNLFRLKLNSLTYPLK